MIYTIHIPDNDERISFAAKVGKLFDHYNEYIPKRSHGLYQCDIGIQATVTNKQLKQVLGLIKRRGYSYSKHES
ncbi:MAG TPA: hypothetical protein DHN29_03790 [Cytophagales bacterium]|nr:hypothetical protein [Cytophagales bacterium]